jgi:hypothetical protein
MALACTFRGHDFKELERTYEGGIAFVCGRCLSVDVIRLEMPAPGRIVPYQRVKDAV